MSLYPLYGGEVALVFDEAKHRYKVAGESVPSVTAITGVISKGDGLLNWAVNCAVDYFKNYLKPGRALDELEIMQMCDGAGRAHRRKVETAANIGTLVHSWIEAHIKHALGQGAAPEEPHNETVKRSVEAFLEWEKGEEVEYIASERKIFSRKHTYAGTLDVLCRLKGKLTIGDAKTSSGIYVEHHLQTAAYAMAVEEEDGEEVQNRVIWHIDKKRGTCTLHDLSREGSGYKADKVAFLAARKLYERIYGR